MTQPIFEFSAARAKAEIARATTIHPNLLLSLYEISQKKKMEAEKEKASKKASKIDKKDKKREKVIRIRKISIAITNSTKQKK